MLTGVDYTEEKESKATSRSILTVVHSGHPVKHLGFSTRSTSLGRLPSRFHVIPGVSSILLFMADRDSDDEHGSPPPPQRRVRPEPHHPHRRDDSNAASPTHLSPPASPSMSLYSLRMSPLSPLFPQPDPDRLNLGHGDPEDATQDSRDGLVQRLNDLAARLSQQHHVRNEDIDVLHAKVDELENVLHTPHKSSKRETRPPRPPPLSLDDDNQDGSNHTWEPPDPGSPLPSDAFSLTLPKPASPSPKTGIDHQAQRKAKSRASKLTVAQAEQVLAEAQDLHKSLEVHIHALLITRLERAAQRIIELEEQLQDLEIQRKESETELLNLRIQLKAIEVQCLSYVPKDADRELSESIDVWKKEWSALKQRRARNKENSFNHDTPTRRRPPPAAK
ncbi:hypothetical protein FHL15_001749 [Xylaria flabelliformis]|uniref:Uncharacterized protein n=1 Tax=Xylaria flabelliformis TaxID=2512241 RepID=A0A553IB97_9PEZI|nr:hypothetical protein FHL15_001749 [Xylaria flabelliformis]